MGHSKMRDRASRSAVGFIGRASVCSLLGLWLAGCSSDATRLSETFSNPFSNPFSTASNDAPTPAASSASAAPVAPTPKVVSQPLAPVSSAQPAGQQPAVASAAQPITGFTGNWTPVGGSPIVVGQGETLASLSQRYGVPTSAILSANALNSGSDIHPGARIVIPVYTADGKNAVAAKASKPETVASEDASPKPKAKKKKLEEDADADDDASKGKKKPTADVADSKTKPAPDAVAKGEPPAVKPDANSAAVAKADQPKPTPKKKLEEDQPTTTASLTPADTKGATTAAEADASGSTPEFRWPARGRIIQGFKTNGNDGINIAVPEGTSVRAAESGVVAYAGNGIKGYGNLVLIRHPNGFVTAYANNGEIDVKMGETIKRGQIIAKSGQTGNVDSPQLHFELRKDNKPVDPTEYLAGL